jgi:hypothetical protein
MFDFVFKVDATSNDFPAWDDFFDEENQSTVGDSPQISSPIFNEPTSKSQLIGSSEERASFFTELEGKVRRSELADQEKARENERKKREAERREELRLSREARVFPEVEIDDPSHMLVNVRHISFGIVTRSFKKEWSVSAVYDWIGSMSAQPEHFSLTCAITKKLIFPDVKCETVQRTTLNMSEREIPVPLSEDEKEVFFYAGNSSHFEVTDDTVVTNTNSFELEQASSIPPQQLLSGDENDSSQSYDAEMSTYRKLQDIRQTELDKMHETCIALIDKSRIVEEVLKLYEDEALIRKRLSVSFVDAVVTGSGPQREMFSLFWNSFLSENGIGYSQFTFRVHPHFPLERYPILGRIITHQFLLCGTFPIQLARASFEEIVTGSAGNDHDCLMQSFLSLLPPGEEQILANALSGRKFDQNEVVDILSEFEVRVLPTPSNITSTIIQVAKAELIHKPYIALKKIQETMPQFWKTISRAHIEVMYQLTYPSKENVLKILSSTPADGSEEKVFRWLCRYVKESDGDVLGNLVRFVTASSVVIPGECISVRYEAMPLLAMRPKSKTCFKTLVLPKCYNTFRSMKDNLDFYLRNQSQWDLED